MNTGTSLGSQEGEIYHRKRGKEGGREKNIDVRGNNQLPPVHIPTRDQTFNLGMCLDRESNPQPFW